MRVVLAILLLCVGAAWAADLIGRDELRARRAALRKDLDSVVVLFGAGEGADEVFGFVQEPNFYYLTGWTEPGAVLLITPTRETLFLPHHNEKRERFTGRRSSAEDQSAAGVTGFETVLPIEKFESQLGEALAASENLMTLADRPGALKLKTLYPLRDMADAAPLITKLRVKKSAAEIAAIQRATNVTLEAHRAAWKRMSAGLYEYQLAATVTNVYLENGCERYAYSPIIGSGPNGAVLHYSANKRRMDRGELVVMDTAAECGEYASDITRTVPVSGKFSARQRELYQIVLGAQNAALAAVKPGVRLGGEENSLYQIARDYMNAHGKDLHGEKLGKYFTHGLGHQVGIEVHDPNVTGPLEAGMVITIEPGLYIPEEGFGIRIEDVVLVTDKGAKVLSAALPREPDEIEKALAR